MTGGGVRGEKKCRTGVAAIAGGDGMAGEYIGQSDERENMLGE